MHITNAAGQNLSYILHTTYVIKRFAADGHVGSKSAGSTRIYHPLSANKKEVVRWRYLLAGKKDHWVERGHS